MTERQWRACTDPYRMAELLGAASRRKTTLLVCAAVRHDTGFAADPAVMGLVEAAERLADGAEPSPEQLASYDRLLGEPAYQGESRLRFLRPDSALGCYDIREVAHVHFDPEHMPGPVGSDYFRCLFGVPFVRRRFSTVMGYAMREFFGLHSPSRRHGRRSVPRAVDADPAWLTPVVLAIAAGIDADRAFDRLPVLADALEDAGCCHADLLGHCRGGGPHARGCWVVDLVLGKE